MTESITILDDNNNNITDTATTNHSSTVVEQDVLTNHANSFSTIQKMLPIRMISTVIHGYGRGSTDLGIPTANLDRTKLQSSCPFDDLPTGIYWGYARIITTNNTNPTDTTDTPTSNNTDGDDNMTGITTTIATTTTDDDEVFQSAISIGYNPTYGNTCKTVEPHLIATENDPRRHLSCTGETLLNEFYNSKIRLSIVGYIRPELPFEGLDQLIIAIKHDIQKTVQLSSISNEVISSCTEKTWVQSNDPI